MTPDDWRQHRAWMLHLLLQAEHAATSGDARAADGLLADGQDRLAQIREALPA